MPGPADAARDRREVEDSDPVSPCGADVPVFGTAATAATDHAEDAGAATAGAGAGRAGAEEALSGDAAEGGVFVDDDGQERGADYWGDVPVGREM